MNKCYLSSSQGFDDMIRCVVPPLFLLLQIGISEEREVEVRYYQPPIRYEVETQSSLGLPLTYNELKCDSYYSISSNGHLDADSTFYRLGADSTYFSPREVLHQNFNLFSNQCHFHYAQYLNDQAKGQSYKSFSFDFYGGISYDELTRKENGDTLTIMNRYYDEYSCGTSKAIRVNDRLINSVYSFKDGQLEDRIEVVSTQVRIDNLHELRETYFQIDHRNAEIFVDTFFHYLDNEGHYMKTRHSNMLTDSVFVQRYKTIQEEDSTCIKYYFLSSMFNPESWNLDKYVLGMEEVFINGRMIEVISYPVSQNPALQGAVFKKQQHDYNQNGRLVSITETSDCTDCEPFVTYKASYDELDRTVYHEFNYQSGLSKMCKYFYLD